MTVEDLSSCCELTPLLRSLPDLLLGASPRTMRRARMDWETRPSWRLPSMRITSGPSPPVPAWHLRVF